MGDLVRGHFTTTQPISARRVLAGAVSAKLESCLLLGVNADGFYMAATHSDIGEHLLLLERARIALMSQVDA